MEQPREKKRGRFYRESAKDSLLRKVQRKSLKSCSLECDENIGETDLAIIDSETGDLFVPSSQSVLDLDDENNLLSSFAAWVGEISSESSTPLPLSLVFLGDTSSIEKDEPENEKEEEISTDAFDMPSSSLEEEAKNIIDSAENNFDSEEKETLATLVEMIETNEEESQLKDDDNELDLISESDSQLEDEIEYITETTPRGFFETKFRYNDDIGTPYFPTLEAFLSHYDNENVEYKPQRGANKARGFTLESKHFFLGPDGVYTNCAFPKGAILFEINGEVFEHEKGSSRSRSKYLFFLTTGILIDAYHSLASKCHINEKRQDSNASVFHLNLIPGVRRLMPQGLTSNDRIYLKATCAFERGDPIFICKQDIYIPKK